MTDQKKRTNPLWCDKHEHFKRNCPWCEIEQLQTELDSAKKVQTVTDQSYRQLMEERETLIEGLREVFEMQKSMHTASKTSLHVQAILKSIGIEV